MSLQDVRRPISENASAGAGRAPDGFVERIVTAWPEPVLLADRSGAVVAMNDGARRVLGLVAGDPADSLAGLLGPDEAEALLGADPGGVERVAGDETISGGRPIVRARSAPLGTAHVVVCLADASGESRLRSHLGLAEKLASIGELLSSVAHELNNPLTTILGYADLLLSEDDPTLPRDELGRIRSEALRCKRIVGNLLDLARADAPDVKPVSVKQVVEKVLEFRTYAAASSGIELVGQLDNDPPVILGDFHRLVQAVLNLVTNAEDAVRGRAAPRRITLRLREGPGSVIVEVEDTGAGVPEAVREFIFQPFFTTKPRGKGTGLGLSLVRSTARLHGGDARVEQAPGGGALFLIELPVASLDPAPSRPAAS